MSSFFAKAIDAGLSESDFHRVFLVGERALLDTLPRGTVDSQKAKFEGKSSTARAMPFFYAQPESGRPHPVIGVWDDVFLTRSRWTNWPYYGRAIVNAKAILEGAEPFWPDYSYYCDYDLPTDHMPEIVAIDTEGRDRVYRFSIAWRAPDGEVHAASVPSTNLSMEFLRRMVGNAKQVWAWSARHDVDLLSGEGLDIPPAKVVDLMLTHQHLHGWARRGIGWAAPLYGLFTAWKHLAKNDISLYSLLDAANLIPMGEEMMRLVTERRSETLHAFDQAAERVLPFRAKPTLNGEENTVTKVAGLLERA